MEQEKQAAEANRKSREELRLSELHRTLGIELFPVPTPKPNLTLDEARQQLVHLRSQIRDIETHLKAQYPNLQASPEITKDMFETTAEYEARRAKATADHTQLEQAYSKDLAILTESHKKQIGDLLSQQYGRPGLNVTFTKYDADRQRLFATVGNCAYWFGCGYFRTTANHV